jgi:hypothetical protein
MKGDQNRMNDEKSFAKQEEMTEKVGIFVKRILAKYYVPECQVLFQEKIDPITGAHTGVKEALKLFMNNAGENGENPIQGITEVIMSLTETPSSVIITNTKSRVKIIFKVFLLVKYQDMAAPSLIVLPDDIGTKCYTSADLTIPQHKENDHPRETLQISDGNFLYIADIPLSEFDNQMTSYQLHDPTLQPYVVLKNFSWSIDVDDVVRSDSGNSATATTISICQDVLNKISIDQDLEISGIAKMY